MENMKLCQKLPLQDNLTMEHIYKKTLAFH